MKIDSKRVVPLMGTITVESAAKVLESISKLVESDSTTGPTQPIYLVINSGGGLVDAGNMLVDLLPTIVPELVTIGTGRVGSMAVPIFCVGKKRLVTRHTRFFFHDVGVVHHKDEQHGLSEMRSYVVDLDQLQSWYKECIVSASGGVFTDPDLTGFMKNETYIYPPDLIRLGLVHEIIGA